MATFVVQSLTVVANTESAQHLTEFSEERLRGNAALAFYVRCDVIDLTVTLTAGTRLLLDQVPVNTIAGTGVDVNTDQIMREGALGGEKLQLTFRKTSAGNAVVQAMLVVNYL